MSKWSRNPQSSSVQPSSTPISSGPQSVLPPAVMQNPDGEFSRLSTGHKMMLREILRNRGTQTLKEIAFRERVSLSTLQKIENDHDLEELSNDQWQISTKKSLAGNFYRIADLALNSIDQFKLLRLNGYQLAMVSAICLDKARLIEGESTSNVNVKDLAVHIHTNLVELRERKTQLMKMFSGRENLVPMSSEERVKTDAVESPVT